MVVVGRTYSSGFGGAVDVELVETLTAAVEDGVELCGEVGYEETLAGYHEVVIAAQSPELECPIQNQWWTRTRLYTSRRT